MEKNKLELLAPAGSKEALVAAIRAGADSVYLGIDKYNARLNADKLNLYDLEVLTGYAHSKKVKVYLALNTLIKHEEVIDVVRTLERIRSFKPDALIVQDLGIARIIKEEFPEINLHASTQMSVHNSAGAETLAGLGFKRVILARELSKSDLKIIASKSPIELEVFCHGALCFCVSGMCFFSSFIGSRSGNRGWCTQPCRRIWLGGKKKGYLFSPKDLQLAREINFLKSAGIKALKIEGRMRSSEYVYNVAKAYRILIDSPDGEMEQSLEEADKYLAMDWAREKTTLFFSGADNTLFTPENAQCLGRNAGIVVSSNGKTATLDSSFPLKEGDRIRISDPAGDITKNIKLPKIIQEGAFATFDCDEVFKPGNPVFKAGDALWDEKSLTKEVDSIYQSYHGKIKNKPANLNYPNLIARQWLDKNAISNERLWIKIDDPDWLELLPLTSNGIMTVLYITRENMHAFKNIVDTIRYYNTKLSCELTPYISQKEFSSYERVINGMSGADINFCVLNNISHFKLFSNDTQKISGHFLYTANAFTGRVLKDLGVKYFVTSWEDDFLNIKRVADAGMRSRLIVYLFGFPPVVRTRMLGRYYLEEGKITNKLDEKFTLKYESGSGVLLPSNPVMNFTVRRKLAGLGIMNFGIDLSFVKPDKKKWEELYGCYLNQENLPGTEKFNFKRGLK